MSSDQKIDLLWWKPISTTENKFSNKSDCLLTYIYRLERWHLHTQQTTVGGKYGTLYVSNNAFLFAKICNQNLQNCWPKCLWFLGRNVAWTLKNKRPERLKDNLTEVEVENFKIFTWCMGFEFAPLGTTSDALEFFCTWRKWFKLLMLWKFNGVLQD